MGLHRLDKCVVQKEQIESDLYGKFAVILNEKKAKIRELKDRPSVESVQIDNGDEGSNPRDEERKEGLKEEGDEAMDMEDDDTDEERQREESFRKRKKRTAALTQSKTKQRDDSSMFDDEQPEEATTTRRRKREPTSRKTASSQKTSIPRVPSGGTPSTSRAPSLRKTPSREKSQRETDNVDDLLDEF
ncbi:DNA repair protein XRCC4-like [Lytechinus variegatus]|uniref:DNA repair protein XRCC4-like n=1 Tax=Lytechinus variegatus TaxID=7654 RepID=UPI001BB1AB27|nr:DNA repair protein XRCC4-like [Lytechinus variegatus]